MTTCQHHRIKTYHYECYDLEHNEIRETLEWCMDCGALHCMNWVDGERQRVWWIPYNTQKEQASRVVALHSKVVWENKPCIGEVLKIDHNDEMALVIFPEAEDSQWIPLSQLTKVK